MRTQQPPVQIVHGFNQMCTFIYIVSIYICQYQTCISKRKKKMDWVRQLQDIYCVSFVWIWSGTAFGQRIVWRHRQMVLLFFRTYIISEFVSSLSNLIEKIISPKLNPLRLFEIPPHKVLLCREKNLFVICFLSIWASSDYSTYNNIILKRLKMPTFWSLQKNISQNIPPK